ncbi:VWA domain-containing protein [Pseudenhygromyxa sp. WMMC2535]|uniref:vWA domain-containing protein n=1 Tax=Pseudenhygromyxa sp. WMMC2535 TaxID=2712867 RepID=UPI001554EC71|nr:VWA domain-containing protein [Pseudenhygromyxa sp. WMMC2535]NVB41524.1 VWA domain-containing protein [Pseudenhygromyxa sp. WMMC2535]
MSRIKLGSKFALLAGAAMAIGSLTGCLSHPLKPVELEKEQEDEKQLQLTVNKDVDVLFVIDNSGSMGEEQANLAANFGSFIEVLEAEDVEANYRIGVTTSDNGNPWCAAGTTTPEAGKLVLSSCTTRLDEFLFGDSVDVQDLACNDICNLTADQLEIQPTTTDEDANEIARPWLENIEGKTNIPEGTSTVEAFQCFGPQGVNGCGFESQLESMYLALIRATTQGEESYGFLRSSAILAIVHVTDEADCSYNKNWAEIFEQDGNRVFWSNPDESFPTSAVCWNAGVTCSGDPSGYDSCDATDKDVDGNAVATDQAADNAVLHPMSRYIGFVQGLEETKKELNPDQEVIVATIGGVANDGSVFYSDVTSTDPDFQTDFGIGPGCDADGTQAVPPVRLRDFTNAFTQDNLFSVCNADYSPALEAIAERIRDQIQPACYAQCVKDTDDSTEIMDPECTVEEKSPGVDTQRIDECLTDANGYVIDANTNDYSMPSDDVNVCYALLVDDSGLTADTADDMSQECIDLNYNLEFKIARRQGFPAPGGTAISATCSVSDFQAVDCPNLGSAG